MCSTLWLFTEGYGNERGSGEKINIYSGTTWRRAVFWQTSGQILALGAGVKRWVNEGSLRSLDWAGDMVP